MTPEFPHRSEWTLTYESSAAAETVHRAVGLEEGAIADDRCETTLTRAGPTVTLTVRARDLTALRAAHNTWLRLLDAAETTREATA